MVDFGNRLYTLRKDMRLTQQALSVRLGVTKAMISAYETGIRYPSYEILIKMADVFGVSTDYLLGRTVKNQLSADGLSEKQLEIICSLIAEFRTSHTPEKTKNKNLP